VKNRAVFLDRDGTINKDVGYPDSFQKIEIYPYSYDAVQKIKEAGFMAVVITNQSGVGRGLIKEQSLGDIHLKMRQAFARRGISFDGIYHCPHYVHSKNPLYRIECDCRKPRPGLGVRAASDLDIDTSRSYMIGDKVEDILFGLNIEAEPILVLTGYGQTTQKQLKNKGIDPAYIAPTLLEAVNWIIKREKKG
jgi:D-glycero-D-manno-heptose 1,7-bisphosphate phosphatase